MKKRKFGNGGSVSDEVYKSKEYQDDKAAGLKASAGEKVGFFERMKAGNIDDPRSEAYRRFGAGRGKADREKADADFAAEEARNAKMNKVSGSPAAPVATPAPVVEQKQAAPRPLPAVPPPAPKPAPKAAPVATEKKESMPPLKQVEKQNKDIKSHSLAAHKEQAEKKKATLKDVETKNANIKSHSATAHKAKATKPANPKLNSLAARRKKASGSKTVSAPSLSSKEVEKFDSTAQKPKKRYPGLMQYGGAYGGESLFNKGGSVRGSGIAQRGVKKCKMV